MVYRIYVEKKKGLELEARSLESDIRTLLGINAFDRLRILNRYDVENIERELFEKCVTSVFSEPQLDDVYYELPDTAGKVFAVEFLPGQFDQRADSAAQCIQIISQGERPSVKTAKVYILEGSLTKTDLKAVKKYVINPVECREASLEPVETLAFLHEVPPMVDTLDGFRSLGELGLANFISRHGLAMDLGDIVFCQRYFEKEKRDPTITEIRVIDTYWSDHCRHTTFNTIIDSVLFEDSMLAEAWNKYIETRKKLGRTKPASLMDIGTIAARTLKSEGKLPDLDESEEINACTVKIKIEADGESDDWLLLFKNETHNHPTEIEPFGGAATCIGGAIRDPLSGRAYVYAAMRLSGGADPRIPVSETLPGKLPQRKLLTTAAAGYSSYGNQIGIATGQVDELYSYGYAAKHMEIGAVLGAVPMKNVRREKPLPDDVVILLGGRTGRDGMGGATGSSKSHTRQSLETCGAEVQKGNAPEERKLQRLFRNGEASKMIKRCNDFGAGGVSVAIGELAEGLEIDLNAVPKKYSGLDGTELAISESQERMAVVISPENIDAFMALAAAENLEATVVARVTENPRLVMNWDGCTIVDISRDFLNTNGVEKHIDVSPAAPEPFDREIPENFSAGILKIASDINTCSRRGMAERFDSTIGAGTILMPFGGKYQLTPIQAMTHKIPVENKHTDDCSVMSWGFNPDIAEKSPFHSAYLAVVESVSKLIASGAEFKNIYLTFQEYFEKPLHDPKRWGKPLAALLGAFQAQIELGIAAIGGKDSMSGSFEKLDVPPTLVSFAVTTEKAENIVSPEFKSAGHRVALIRPDNDKYGLPVAQSLCEIYSDVTKLMREGKIHAAWTSVYGGAAEGIMKMSFGNMIGLDFAPNTDFDSLFAYSYGSFILETDPDVELGVTLGRTNDREELVFGLERIDLKKVLDMYESTLENVYPCNIVHIKTEIPSFSFEAKKRVKCSNRTPRPRVLIPVFPGTNCEYDTTKAILDAGAEPEIFIVRNLTSSSIRDSVSEFARLLRNTQIILIPGGFSGGDEPDGSGKFITAFFRNGLIKDEVHNLIKKRDGLICGICNGFQALIKLGLVPFGEIVETDETFPTLTFNTIGRHQSRLITTRIASNMSPWLSNTRPGEIYTVPISHGEGRFLCSDELISILAENGQIATQYVDPLGTPTEKVSFNPNNSKFAIEGITSPDGRVFGKMGHSERIGSHLYKNVPGEYDMKMFSSAVAYFR